MARTNPRHAQIVYTGLASMLRYYATGYADALAGADRWKDVSRTHPEDGMMYADGHREALAGTPNRFSDIPAWEKL